MLLLLPLAVRIEPLAECADALLERGFGERGEWERFETAGFVIAGIVAHAHSATCG